MDSFRNPNIPTKAFGHSGLCDESPRIGSRLRFYSHKWAPDDRPAEAPLLPIGRSGRAQPASPTSGSEPTTRHGLRRRSCAYSPSVHFLSAGGRPGPPPGGRTPGAAEGEGGGGGGKGLA